MEEAIVDFAKEGYNRASNFVKGMLNKDVQEEEPLPASLSLSGYDFVAVVEQNNRNIESVVQDANLRRKTDVDYGIKNFATMPGVGSAEVLDAVYGAMISYNSKWIDYVNDGKKDVLDVLKADGNAYYNAVNFDKIGQISENFEKLALGEVVANGNTVYVFDEETIGVTLDDESSSQTRTWLYELVKVGGEYKIVDYKAI